MKITTARIIGHNLAGLLQQDDIDQAYDLLEPVLKEKTPFPALTQIGCLIGECQLDSTIALLEKITNEKTMGGWVVIGGALSVQLDSKFEDAFFHCRDYIVAADVWYATDTLGERVPGPALVKYFDRALLNLTICWSQCSLLG
jgi:hypothetical protein